MRGSITIFFSLIFVTIVSVLGMTIESARWACARLYWKQAADDSIRSVFADYCEPLFKEYGLLFVDKTYGQGFTVVEDKIEDYILYNMNPNHGSALKKSFLYKGTVENIEVLDTVLAIDGNGAVLRKAAYNHMKYRIPANFVEEFLEQFDFISQASIIQDFFDKIQGVQEDLALIDAVIMEINTFVDEMRQMQAAIQKLLGEINQLLTIKKPDKATTKLLEEKKEGLRAAKQKVIEIINKIIADSGVYDAVTAKAHGYLQDIADEWLNKTDISQNIKNIIQEELNNLLKYSGGRGDVYGIEKSKGILDGLGETLSKWLADDTIGWLEELNDIEITIDWQDALPETVIKGFDAEKLWKEFKAGGLYTLLCPNYNGLSEATIEPFDNRSYVNDRAKAYVSQQTADEKLIEDVVFQEYIQEMFSSYVNQKNDTAIKYELEYIIGGNLKDKDNINVVINELLLVREALNLIYIVGDAQKRSEAHALAMSCLGFTGIYVAVKALQYLILMVWALGEAMLDVRIIMSGGTVPVIKSAKDWKLNLSSLLNMGEVLKSLISPEKETGFGDWSYEDYLKILLYLQNRDVQTLRVMDLIEANIQKNYSKDFRIINCAYRIDMRADFRLKPLFSKNDLFYKKTTMKFGYSY